MVNISLSKSFVKISSGMFGLIAALIVATTPTTLAQPTSSSNSSTNNSQSQTSQSDDTQAQNNNDEDVMTTTSDEAAAEGGVEQEEQKEFNTGGEGTCAGEKVDFFACEGDGAEAIASIFTQIMMVMSIGVGIVATGFLTYAGIMYASAQDNREQVQKSIGIVRNVVVGILLYVFMVAIVDWLVPGGIFDQPAEDTNQSQNANTQDESTADEDATLPDEEAGANSDQNSEQSGN